MLEWRRHYRNWFRNSKKSTLEHAFKAGFMAGALTVVEGATERLLHKPLNDVASSGGGQSKDGVEGVATEAAAQGNGGDDAKLDSQASGNGGAR